MENKTIIFTLVIVIGICIFTAILTYGAIVGGNLLDQKAIECLQTGNNTVECRCMFIGC